MKLQPIIYTTDMDRAVAWYKIVLDLEPSYTSDMWTAFAVGDAALGIHRVNQPTNSGDISGDVSGSVSGNVALSLVATQSLETILARLEAAGVTIERGIQDETFGRSLLLRNPDGSVLQVNEHEH